MNNRELISKLSGKLEGRYTRAEIDDIVGVLLEVITHTLNTGESVSVTSLGKFSIQKQPPRRFYNIRTGQVESTGFKSVVVFTPSNKLQNRLTSD